MNGTEIAFLTLALSCQGTLLLFVWRAAATFARHDLKLETLEKLSDRLDEMHLHIIRLDKKLAVGEARSSQGQFDEGATDRPPPPRR